MTGMGYVRSGLWAGFAILVSLLAYTALHACMFAIPGLGIIAERCPKPAEVRASEFDDLVDLGNLLARQLAELRAKAMQVPACGSDLAQDKEDSGFPPDLKIPVAKQLIVILDTSGSMQFAADSGVQDNVDARGSLITDAVERNLLPLDNAISSVSPESRGIPFLSTEQLDALRANDAKLAARVEQLQKTWEGLPQERMMQRRQVAIDAIAPILEVPPVDLPISVWGFRQCDEAPLNIYNSGDPLKVVGNKAVTPRQLLEDLRFDSATPLASTIQYIAKMIKPGAGLSEDFGVNVFVLSDGAEQCNGNVCEAAREIHAKYPYLWIHVTSMASGTIKDLRCIAEETGGVALETEQVDDLKKLIRFVAQKSAR